MAKWKFSIIALTLIFLIFIFKILRIEYMGLVEQFIFNVFLPSLIFLTSLVIYWNSEGSIRYYPLSFSIFSLIYLLIDLHQFLSDFTTISIQINPEPFKLFAIIPIISAGSYIYPDVWKYLRIKHIAVGILISSGLIIASFYPFIPITLDDFYTQPVVFILSLLIFMAIFINSFFIWVFKGGSRTLMLTTEIFLVLLYLSNIALLYESILNFRVQFLDLVKMLEDISILILFLGLYRVYTTFELPSIDLLERKIEEYRYALENITGYKKFFDNAEDFLFRLDIDGNFVDVNSKITEILGYDIDEMRGIKFLRIVSREDRRIFNQKIENVLKGEREKFRAKVVKKGGSALHMDILMWPWIEKTTLKGVEGIARDVSDIIEAEKNIRNLNEYLTVLNKILRHDIQNDIAVIKMYIDLTKEGDTDVGTAIEKINDRVTHALATIKDVRELERMLSIGELVGVNVSSALKNRIQEFSKDAKITHSIPENVYVEADSAINSVFHNIIQNAIFHNDKEVVEIDIKVEVKGDKVFVRIADNGPGIPDSMKELIFRESFKGETTGRSGLGLYLVKETMKRYGGNVWVEDNEPCGSIFVLEFKKSTISEEFQKISGINLE